MLAVIPADRPASAQPRDDAGGDDDQRGDFGCRVDIVAARCYVRGNGDENGAASDEDRERALPAGSELACHARQAAEQGERANAGKARHRTDGFSGPLPLHPDRRSAERRDDDPGDDVEARCVHSWCWAVADNPNFSMRYLI